MKYAITIPCRKEKLQEIRLFVRSSLQDHGLDEVEINALVLAIDEISANVIIHAHKNNPKDLIDLNIEIQKGRGIIFKIIDDGVGFDITQYKAPDLKEIIRTKRKGGIGLILVRKIMDDITFESSAGKNCCRLYKKADVY